MLTKISKFTFKGELSHHCTSRSKTESIHAKSRMNGQGSSELVDRRLRRCNHVYTVRRGKDSCHVRARALQP